MNTIDIIIGIVLLFGLIKGFIKGFFVEVTSLVGLVLGVYGAIHFSFYLSGFLKGIVSWDASVIQIASFAGTFLIILFALVLLGKAITKIAETASLGLFNKMLGALFGIIKYGLILSVSLLIFAHLNKSMKFVNKGNIDQSILYEPVKSIAPSIFPNLIEVVDKTKSKGI